MPTLTYRPPFDWDGIAAWIGARAIAGVESIADGVYTRGGVEVRHVAPRHALVISHRGSLGKTRRLFDVDADPREIGATLGKDPLLAPLLRKRPGVRVPGAWDPFELAVRAIVGQQISVAGARTILGRIAASHGFVPERLADVLLEGMPVRRAETIRGIARAVAGGTLVLERGKTSIGALTELPGIGPWTAHYIAMRALGDPDAFPAGDLILRRNAGGLMERELLRRAEAWRPFRAYAAMLLWMG